MKYKKENAYFIVGFGYCDDESGKVVQSTQRIAVTEILASVNIGWLLFKTATDIGRRVKKFVASSK